MVRFQPVQQLGAVDAGRVLSVAWGGLSPRLDGTAAILQVPQQIPRALGFYNIIFAFENRKCFIVVLILNMYVPNKCIAYN